jgi:hypothetical protein
MKWKKLGLIFCANKNSEWMQTHASLPFADHLKNNDYRIFFSSRNSDNHAQVGYLDIDITQPNKILNLSENPVLSIGDLGSFDEHGVMGSSLVNFKGKKYLYYIGWNVEKSIPFRWSIGLAISKDGGNTFEKFSKGPILDRNHNDPYMVSSPTVIYDNNLWRMYYISPTKCIYENDTFKAPYNIRYAESEDGINWKRNGIVAIDFKYQNEFAIGRASIIKENNLFRMWYSYSIDKYRIGYAESKDGIRWERKDEGVGITVSESGWDSESIEHCYVFNHLNSKYMLYSGNDFGKSGFGIASLDSI